MGVQAEGKTGERKLLRWGQPLGGADEAVFCSICFACSAPGAKPQAFFCQGLKPEWAETDLTGSVKRKRMKARPDSDNY
jgi:hypothetical protein